MNSPASDTTFHVGELLNNTFRIEAVLGRGGTSEVFRARNEISGRLVALKVLKAEFAGNENFLVLMKREEEMRDIRHDAVVGYSENHRTAEGHIYLVMDFVDGPSLEAKMKKGGMSAEDLLIVARRVAQGLHAAHERRIVHRDLSPDNIILKGGDPARAVIIDFGIAKDSNPGASTIVGTEFAGKFAYAAPEQMGGHVDARSDIYALGMTLLATFQGHHPKVGGNLLEVLEAKKLPPDVSAVPEPLQSLIARMVEPDPLARFQSTEEILREIAAIESGKPGGQGALDILQGARPTEREAPSRASQPASPQPSRRKEASAGASSAPQKKSSSAMPIVIALVVLLAVGGGAAAWFMGLFGPKLPVADPYTFAAERVELGGPVLTGHVPSQEMLDTLKIRASAEGGTVDLSLARGDIADGWQEAVERSMSQAAALDVFTIRVEGNDITLEGATSDAAVRDRLDDFLAAPALPAGMVLDGQIDFLAPPLSASTLEPILAQHADCGPLSLPNAPSGGYGPDDTIAVTGTLASANSRLSLYDALSSVAEGRDVTVETELLNPALCLVEHELPKVPPGGIGIDFGFGESGKPNPSGRFLTGENPVIDIVLPADMLTGYLYVSIIDVTGSVFHLLPNVNRSGNSVADLRGLQDGPVSIRVAFPVSDAAPDRIAFLVDDSLLGKSKILVLHSDEPLFDTLRPTAESVEGYVEALTSGGTHGTGDIQTLDSRVLEMVAP